MIVAIDVGRDLATPVIQGVIQGSVYGLLGLGLVLLYKGNRIFNFAQAEFASASAMTTYAGVMGLGFLPVLPYWAAVLLALVVGTSLGLLTERLVVRPLFRQPRVTLAVATAGVALLLIGIQGGIFGAGATSMPPMWDGDLYNGGALRVTKQALLIVIFLAVLALAAALFFKFSRLGLAILAVSQEPTATSLVGISVNRISALTWGMAGFLGAIAGVLLGGYNGTVGAGIFTLIALIPAFTAAVFGGMTSLPGAFVGGIVIGVIEALSAANIPADVIPSANQVVLFAVLLVVLLARPAGLLGKEA